MGKGKKKANSIPQENDEGTAVLSLLVVALLGVAVGAALALMPSENDWKGPPRRNGRGEIVSSNEERLSFGQRSDDKMQSVEGRDQNKGLVMKETAEEIAVKKERARARDSAMSTPPQSHSGSAASEYSIGGNVAVSGAEEFNNAAKLAASGVWEEAMRSYVFAFERAGNDELKRKIARDLLLKWKQSCIDLKRDVCGAQWLLTVLNEIWENESELELSASDVFDIAYILQSNDDYEKALEFYRMAEERDNDATATTFNALINQAVTARLLGKTDEAIAAERRRWNKAVFPSTHRNVMPGSRCGQASYLTCHGWSELWDMPSIPDPISRASQLLVRSKVKTHEIHHTDGSPAESYCLPQMDTGHVVLKDVSVSGRELWIYDDCTVFGCGFRFPARDNAASELDHINTPQKIVTLDRVAVLPPKHMKNFYHFAVEAMANLALLFDQVVPNIPNDSLPHQDKPLVLLVGASKQADRLFAYEILVLLAKVRPDIAATIEWYDIRNRYDIGELHMVDWYRSPDPVEKCPEGIPELHSAFEMYYAPCELVEKHAALLNRAVSRSVPLQDTIVFFSRRTSPRDDRRIVNEDYLLSQVKATLLDFNIAHGTSYRLAIHDGSLTVEEQVKLMRKSKIAFGTHGASMSNIMHAQPGAALIEFPLVGDGDIQHFFRHIAACVGVDYYTADGLGVNFYGNLTLTSDHDQAIQHLLDTIVAILEASLMDD